MKGIAIFLVVIIIIGGIMFLTNPTKDDFDIFMGKKASRNIAKYASGSTGRIDDLTSDVKPTVISYNKTLFTRENYYLISIYNSKSPSKTDGEQYLGLFKFFIFIK